MATGGREWWFAAAAAADPAAASAPPAECGDGGDVPGSRPDWFGSRPDWFSANVKTRRGKPSESPPPSLLGGASAGGWEGWTAARDPREGLGRRHFHGSALCRETAALGTGASGCDATSAAGGLEQRRHRRRVATPLAKRREEGKRMVAKPLACDSLLQQEPTPALEHVAAKRPQPAPPAAKGAAPAGAAGRWLTAAARTAAGATAAMAVQPPSQPCLASAPLQAPAAAAATPGSGDATPAAAARQPAAGGGYPTSPAGRLRRVEDGPGFFCTPKDSPSFARFCASIRPAASASAGVRRASALEAAARAEARAAALEVAALGRGGI